MKRSKINESIKEMEAMINKCGYKLPPFCGFTPDEWKTKGHEYDEIRDNMLGWDITDYGLDDFDRVGFPLLQSETETRIMTNTQKHMRKSCFT